MKRVGIPGIEPGPPRVPVYLPYTISHRKFLLTMKRVGAPGIEPEPPGHEPDVLPLYHAPQ